LKPLLSASLIVRNEAAHLADCLRSVATIVDEIVAVDTGSTDETREIAVAHGVRLYEAPWQDDFAAARNESLARCSGEWILYIDADERVRPTLRDNLQEILGDPALGGCYVKLIAKAGRLPYREMRLFRRDEAVRFEGVIHENIWPSLRRYLVAAGRSIGDTDLVLDHIGYEGDQAHKHTRNLPLLLKALEQDPSHTYCWYHLGLVRRELGDIEGARAAFQAGIAAACDRDISLSQDSLAFVELAHLELSEGRNARPIVEKLLARSPDHAHGLWLRAQLNLRDGHLDAAEADFRALDAWPQSQAAAEATLGYDPRLFGSLASEGVATCLWRRSDYAGAARWFARAGAAEPGNLEYRVKEWACARLAEEREAGPSS
jgi:tetratricopeptide (TPR) repeat protein